MEPGAKLTQAIPEGWNGFIYTLKGKGLFGKRYTLYLFTKLDNRFISLILVFTKV